MWTVSIYLLLLLIKIRFYNLNLKNIKLNNLGKIIQSRNYIQIGAFIYLIINFIPIIPSGSFFSDFNITLFMINFSLMYGINKETNIFQKNNKNI